MLGRVWAAWEVMARRRARIIGNGVFMVWHYAGLGVVCPESTGGRAERIGVKEQQIQRYEAEEYGTASLRRLIEVSDALELGFVRWPVAKKVTELTTDGRSGL